MKKINSIGYGDKIVVIAVLFLAVIPTCVYIVSVILSIPELMKVILISLVIGGFIVLFVIGLLFIELRQDKRLNQLYMKNINIKLPLGNNRYECQSCGNRQVLDNDRNCKVCGIHFNKAKSD